MPHTLPCAHRHCLAYTHLHRRSHPLRPRRQHRICCYESRGPCPFAWSAPAGAALGRALSSYSSSYAPTTSSSSPADTLSDRARTTTTTDEDAILRPQPLPRQGSRLPHTVTVPEKKCGVSGSRPDTALTSRSASCTSRICTSARADATSRSSNTDMLRGHGPIDRSDSVVSFVFTNGELDSQADTEVCSVSRSEREREVLFRSGRREMDAVRRIWTPHHSLQMEQRRRSATPEPHGSRNDRRIRTDSESTLDGCFPKLFSIVGRIRNRKPGRKTGARLRIPIVPVRESVMVLWREWVERRP